MYKEELQNMITVCKEDPYKRYIWIKIESGDKPIFIAGCYIPHRESPFYEAFKVEKTKPFEDLYADVHTYAETVPDLDSVYVLQRVGGSLTRTAVVRSVEVND